MKQSGVANFPFPMSYHFEHGFRFFISDLNKIHHNLMKLREEIYPLGVKLQAQFLAQTAVHHFDMFTWFGRTPKDEGERGNSPMSAAGMYMLDKQAEIELKKIRHPHVDFSCDICVIPQDTEVLGLLYTEQEDYRKIIEAKPWFVDYSWQNSVDPDDNVSEQEWKDRERSWLKMLKTGRNIPGLAGFGALICPVGPVPFSDEKLINDNMPSFDSRVKDITTESLWREWRMIRNVKIEAHNCVSLMMEFRDWQATDAGRTATLKRTEVVRDKLLVFPTYTDLTKPFES